MATTRNWEVGDSVWFNIIAPGTVTAQCIAKGEITRAGDKPGAWYVSVRIKEYHRATHVLITSECWLVESAMLQPQA